MPWEGELDVEGHVGVVADVDCFGAVDDGVPGLVGGLVLGFVVFGAEVLDVDVLDVSAEDGEAPGEVGVVADLDEGGSGDDDAGYVEWAIGAGGFEVGFVPDAGDGVGEMGIVGQDGLAGGGVVGGKRPVVGAGGAGVAGEAAGEGG